MSTTACRGKCNCKNPGVCEEFLGLAKQPQVEENWGKGRDDVRKLTNEGERPDSVSPWRLFIFTE